MGKENAEHCSCEPRQEKIGDKQWGNEREIEAIQMEIRGSSFYHEILLSFQNTCLIMHQQNGTGEGKVMQFLDIDFCLNLDRSATC